MSGLEASLVTSTDVDAPDQVSGGILVLGAGRHVWGICGKPGKPGSRVGGH